MEANKNGLDSYKDSLMEVKNRFAQMQEVIENQKQVNSALQTSLIDQHEKKNEKEGLLNQARSEYTKEREKRQSLERQLEELRRENRLMREQYGEKLKAKLNDRVMSNEEMKNQSVLKKKLELKYAKTGEKKMDSLGRERATFKIRERALNHDFIMSNVNERDVQGKQHMYKEQINTLYSARHINAMKDTYEASKINVKAASKMGVETLVDPFTNMYEGSKSKLKAKLVNYVADNDMKHGIQGERKEFRSRTANRERANKMLLDREANIQKLNTQPKSKLISRSLAYATKDIGAAIKSKFGKYLAPALTSFVEKKKERFQEIKQDVAKQKQRDASKDNGKAM